MPMKLLRIILSASFGGPVRSNEIFKCKSFSLSQMRDIQMGGVEDLFLFCSHSKLGREIIRIRYVISDLNGIPWEENSFEGN